LVKRKGFIRRLQIKKYNYEISGDKIIIIHKGNVYLDNLTEIPPNVIFSNEGDIMLKDLIHLSPDVEFKNTSSIFIGRSLEIIPREIQFKNRGSVWIQSIYKKAWFHEWKGNIEEIRPTMLLNKMIKDGLFDRK
jgi:hypothetical protein